MKIQIANVLYPVHSLGPGTRLVIWLQGCSIAQAGKPCAGCMSPEYWDFDHGTAYDIQEFARIVTAIVIANRLTGITVSGGEPSDQQEAVCDFFDLTMCDERLADIDWMMFSYFDSTSFKHRFPEIHNRFDAFVLGAYLQESPCNMPLLASANQEMILRTKRAEERYACLHDSPRIEYFLSANGHSIDFVGVPQREEIRSISDALESRGITLDISGGRIDP